MDVTYTGPERRTGERRSALRGPDRRKAGRPRLVAGEQTLPVTVRMPKSQYRELCEVASIEGEKPSAFARVLVARFMACYRAKRQKESENDRAI
jgi:hypothetical protein